MIPKYTFRSLTDITPDFLKCIGVKFLMVDLDNTIATYREQIVSDAVFQWVKRIRRRELELIIVSNSSRANRIEAFAKELGAGFVMRARKPSPVNLLQAMKIAGFDVGESALVGDQIFTDTLAANRAGIISILVHPKRFTNPFLALRYYIEVPFRALCGNKRL